MLVVGISVAAITTKIIGLTQAEQISFIILDYDGNVILQTADNEADFKSPFHTEILQEILTMPKQGFLKNSLLHNHIDYRFYTKMNDLPYIILVGHHSSLSRKKFYALVLPRVLEFSLIPIFCLLLLYLFRKHLIQVSQLSYKAREKFLQTSNEDFLF